MLAWRRFRWIACTVNGSLQPIILPFELLRRLSTQAITTAILKAGVHGPSARSAVMPRVRGNLAYLHNREKVSKSGGGEDVRWCL